MAKDSLSDYFSLIQNQIAHQEQLLEYHAKAGAMLDVILGNGALEHPKSTLYDYLCALKDVVDLATNLNEQLLDVLIKVTPMLMESNWQKESTMH